jgi:fumarate hydratase class II
MHIAAVLKVKEELLPNLYELKKVMEEKAT